MRSSGCVCGINFTPEGSLTLVVYRPGLAGSPATTARRASGGNDGNGSKSMSSDRIDLKPASFASWVCVIVNLLVRWGSGLPTSRQNLWVDGGSRAWEVPGPDPGRSAPSGLAAVDVQDVTGDERRALQIEDP